MRRFADLLRDIPGARLVQGSGDVEVTGVSNDTRRLRPGEVFAAVSGFERDGLVFVPAAIVAGAAAIVAERAPAPEQNPNGVPVAIVPDARAALADLAAAFFGRPSSQLPVVGITGTDGKTSTTHLLSAILQAAGKRTGWLTTVSTRVGETVRENAADHTTPEAPLVQSALAEMLQAGVDVAIVETSSHALALDRVRAVAYRVGVFTNLGAEHLNFHGTFEAYRDAKALLFQRLPPDGLAVLNADDPVSAHFARLTAAPVVTYGLLGSADVRATDVLLGPRGTAFTVIADGQERRLETRLVGRFNVANWLAAYGAGRYFGAGLDALEAATCVQEPVPGRMNLVDAGQPFPVVVDFAHTPQALEKALDTVRSLVSGRVFLVFGLAGGRDAANRPVMGALAASRADFTVISMDDPYDEDPAEIARQIATGFARLGAQRGEQYEIDTDRQSAIERVLGRAMRGDAVLLAGKGHEQRMMVRGQKLPWNDARAARETLARLGFRA
ncbi:MAG: UDP-N-acetylmuramoyl-L-alanyl-D-glutamate--2,6-diaminopimelate ligase [Chloroflexi bacterium]|nr:UDP-N-acetylmuramoyl-L-alanyl-D-glutamate--2,6-diaminopimelate ligase [Chloroflexota bacterium]